jgi:hypothetical protein
VGGELWAGSGICRVSGSIDDVLFLYSPRRSNEVVSLSDLNKYAKELFGDSLERLCFNFLMFS